MQTEHIVPLSRQAIAALRELQSLTGSYDLVFPNRNNISRPMSENTLIYAMYRMGYHSKATVHGFRHGFHYFKQDGLPAGRDRAPVSACRAKQG